ncbi:hypothetical protein CDD83_2855 [Cordyceps sp. RAO-2017]|nr:hypothetical protein CDD83_2855 [Cordyceps sp. RAO-2017]
MPSKAADLGSQCEDGSIVIISIIITATRTIRVACGHWAGLDLPSGSSLPLFSTSSSSGSSSSARTTRRTANRPDEGGTYRLRATGDKATGSGSPERASGAAADLVRCSEHLAARRGDAPQWHGPVHYRWPRPQKPASLRLTRMLLPVPPPRALSLSVSASRPGGGEEACWTAPGGPQSGAN